MRIQTPHLESFRRLPALERQKILARLSDTERSLLALELGKLESIFERHLFYRLFPDDGPLGRANYPKQMEFFRLGSEAKFRALLGGNGAGKTITGGFELTSHAIGEYPHWWQGKRFHEPISGLVAGDTKETVRDILQPKLLGAPGRPGTGIIPADRVKKIMYRPNSGGAIDWVQVWHSRGGYSTISFKSYDQGRRSFQGTERHVQWLDEEAPLDIWEECVHRIRGSARDGILYTTFTPLAGVTDVVQLFLPQLGVTSAETRMSEGKRAVVFCGLRDVPHMSAEERTLLIQNTSAHMRQAREFGIPTAGRGKVYTVEEDAFIVQPFKIPDHWPRAYGADFGFGRVEEVSGTGVVWGAYDRDSDVLYLYDEYFRSEAPPPMHASAIKARGDWIPGVGDYAGRNLDGEKTLDIYRELGLKLDPADKAVDSGLQVVTTLLNEGRLRVFSTLQHWLQEYRLYSYDDRGKIVKKRDHLMDATRYLAVKGHTIAITRPLPGSSPRHKPQTLGLY